MWANQKVMPGVGFPGCVLPRRRLRQKTGSSLWQPFYLKFPPFRLSKFQLASRSDRRCPTSPVRLAAHENQKRHPLAAPTALRAQPVRPPAPHRAAATGANGPLPLMRRLAVESAGVGARAGSPPNATDQIGCALEDVLTCCCTAGKVSVIRDCLGFDSGVAAQTSRAGRSQFAAEPSRFSPAAALAGRMARSRGSCSGGTTLQRFAQAS